MEKLSQAPEIVSRLPHGSERENSPFQWWE